MVKTIAIALCMVVLFAGCHKQETTNASSSSSSSTSTTAPQTNVAETTDVSIHIRGTAALVDLKDATHPMAVILPRVKIQMDHENPHVAYVAWHEENEDGTPIGTIYDRQDPIDKSHWRVHLLVNEELVIDNSLSSNPPLQTPAGGSCLVDFKHGGIATFACVPVASDFVDKAPYDEAYVNKVTSNRDVAGRMELGNGVLTPYVTDVCKWDIAKADTTLKIHQYLAGDIVYKFTIHDSDLVLKLRALSGTAPPALLVNLKPRQNVGLELRFGNAVDIFPKTHQAHVGDLDQHFAAFYDVLSGVSTRRPLPVRTAECSGSGFDPTVYCGPGRVKGDGAPTP